ncbi:MAG: pyridoxal-phosphate dependent enzyme [Candidatus Nanopelagicales bacterium]
MTATMRRVPLAVLPTPLVDAARLAEALGLPGSLFVKRDDLTGFAVAGNKARPLEALLAEAIDQGADVIVTGGAPGSNFIQAATAAAAYARLRCVLVLAGRAGASAPMHPNLAAALAWGAEVHWTGDEDRTSVDDALMETADDLARHGHRPYVIGRGGSTATGALGYFAAVGELLGQLPAGMQPTVVVGCGSGGTLAGLVAGSVAHGRALRLVGASVSRPVDAAAERVLTLARGVARSRGEPLPDASDVVLVDARGPGHAIPSLAGDRAAALALQHAGLVLDPVYTAKALAVLPEVVGDGPAVFWHTGGLLDAVAGWVFGRSTTPEQQKSSDHSIGRADDLPVRTGVEP